MTRIFNKRSQITKRKILRRNAPSPERVLWQALRNRKTNGRKFKRQFSVGRYVADFYCPELRLAIEVDGPQHSAQENKRYDRIRDQFMKSLGIKCLRFSNNDVEKNLKGVINKIESLTSSPTLLLCKEKGA